MKYESLNVQLALINQLIDKNFFKDSIQKSRKTRQHYNKGISKKQT